VSIYIGTSGWSYDHWQGILYPERTPVAKRLAYYVERYDTVEVNSSYYHWPVAATFDSWRQRIPPGFVMTVKAPMGLTHRSRLASPEKWIPLMVDGLQRLGDHLGVLLAQLPPQFSFHPERLEAFLAQAPRWLKIAMEFRHGSWHREETYEILQRYGAAYCVMSGAGLPCELRVTAPFAYVRLHGPDPHHLYGGSYTDENLGWWAQRIREWQADDRDVYAYFNNDGYGNALRNADTLLKLLGVRSGRQPSTADR
jgi:uncharacterized protein YecE (DUF72 family)